MKLPQGVTSRHKIRDARIVRLFVTENLTLEEIGLKFDLTASRIHQILYKNHDLIDWDKKYEKGIRVNALKRMANKYPDNLGKKSSIDIYEQIRKEIDGDKPLVDNRITNISINVKEKSASDIRTGNRITSESILSP